MIENVAKEYFHVIMMDGNAKSTLHKESIQNILQQSSTVFVQFT